jgi:hypothetical protein
MDSHQLERAPLQKLFEIYFHKDFSDQLVLKSIGELNDACWGAWFGEIQKVLGSSKFEGATFSQCHIDLSTCCWADPLPLLSLALTLVEYERKGGKVSINFPSIPSGDSFKIGKNDSKESQQARFLKFLAREGFIGLLADSEIVYLPKNTVPSVSTSRTVKFGSAVYLNQQDIGFLRDLPVSLAFERSTCLLSTLLDMRCPTDAKDVTPHAAIDEWVEQILFRNISQAVYDEAPSWAQDGLRYRLMTFLRETLHNVIEHAYKGHHRGLAVVYVRYREGALGEAQETWDRLKKFSSRENDSRRVPLMEPYSMSASFASTRTGFFEVFVLDAGRGLCRSLESDNLHKAMRDVFKRGVSSKGENRPTQYGGLYLVGELLTPNEDYFRVLDKDTWWATQMPLRDKGTGSVRSGRITIDAYGQEHGNYGVKGLAWTARVSWLEAQDLPGHNTPWQGINNKQEQRAILSVFTESNVDTLRQAVMLVRDSRLPSYMSCDDFSQSFDSENLALLFLPQPRLMKNHIQDEIGLLLKTIGNDHILSLIIGDIPSEEAATYLAAIDHAKRLNNPPFKLIGRVILVTRELKVCVLQRTNELDQSFVQDLKETKAYISRMSDDSKLAPHQNLVDYMRMLRKYDGHRLSMIVTNSTDSIHAGFVEEEVDWHDLTLNGYLDFAQSLTHPLCRAIYSISLQRLIGLFPRYNCTLTGLDSLVDSLVTRFNAQVHPRPVLSGTKRDVQSIHIGSIKVSGYTEKSEKKSKTPVFHFFRHPSGKAKGIFLLPWITHNEIIKKNTDGQRLLRVGRTPVVARDGWKAYDLPRYDKNGDSVYEKSPRDSYCAWQEPSRTPMKLGHWSYGGHHEILTVNLLLAFDTELDRISPILGGSLARFAYANLFLIFGVSEEDLNKHSKQLLSAVKADKYKHLLPHDFSDKKPLLIYPSHPVTDHIIDRFLELLSESAMQKVRSRLVSILPVRRHRSGSGLQVSGLTLERLRAVCSTNTPVVYFDDGVISGRTFAEVKSLLRGIGYRDIYSLVLLDRQRLPSVNHLENGKFVCYWRLDVPSLGSKAHCPLCHAIDRVKILSDSIASQAHRERIASWCETWKELDPSTQWGNAGLRPIPLTLKKPERKFGIKRDHDGGYSQIGGETQQIRLTNSAGLISWVTELHTLTSRDDLPLALLTKETEVLSSEVRIQLLASQLLLFFAEFDSDHALKLAAALLSALWDSATHDRHTALAALTLVSCGDVFLRSVMDSFLDSNRLDELKDRNLDFVLLVAFMLVTGRNNPEMSVNDSRLDAASRLLKPCGKPDLYYRLHREMRDALGKAHSSPLHRLANSTIDIEVQTKETLMNALASAAQIKAITNTLPWHWLRGGTDAHDHFATIKSNIEQKEKELREAIEALLTSRKSDVQYQGFLKNAKNKAKELLKEGEKLHSGLFAPLGIKEMKNGQPTLFFEQQLKQLKTEFVVGASNKNVQWHNQTQHAQKIMVLAIKKPEMEEGYVVWDSEIKEAVQDILSNVSKAETDIPNPWVKNGTLKASLWWCVQMDDLAVHIHMKNKSELKGEEVMKKTAHSHSHHIIHEIGGNVDYSDDIEGLLLTIISLPYAHTLQTKLRENNNGH